MPTTKQDWFQAGMEILGQSGIKGLTIERMTKALAVTKGSFYHHFNNIHDFQSQLVAFWADQYLSTSADLPHDPANLLSLLDTIMQESFGSITKPELAIRTWAFQDENVRTYVERVDAVRRKFVLNVFQSLFESEVQARMMADILFAITIGSITAIPSIPPERVLEMYMEFKHLYGLG